MKQSPSFSAALSMASTTLAILIGMTACGPDAQKSPGATDPKIQSDLLMGNLQNHFDGAQVTLNLGVFEETRALQNGGITAIDIAQSELQILIDQSEDTRFKSLEPQEGIESVAQWKEKDPTLQSCLGRLNAAYAEELAPLKSSVDWKKPIQLLGVYVDVIRYVFTKSDGQILGYRNLLSMGGTFVNIDSALKLKREKILLCIQSKLPAGSQLAPVEQDSGRLIYELADHRRYEASAESEYPDLIEFRPNAIASPGATCEDTLAAIHEVARQTPVIDQCLREDERN